RRQERFRAEGVYDEIRLERRRIMSRQNPYNSLKTRQITGFHPDRTGPRPAPWRPPAAPGRCRPRARSPEPICATRLRIAGVAIAPVSGLLKAVPRRGAPGAPILQAVQG